MSRGLTIICCRKMYQANKSISTELLILNTSSETQCVKEAHNTCIRLYEGKQMYLHRATYIKLLVVLHNVHVIMHPPFT